MQYGLDAERRLVSWHPVTEGTVQNRMGRVVSVVPTDAGVRVYFERASGRRAVLLVPYDRWRDRAP